MESRKIFRVLDEVGQCFPLYSLLRALYKEETVEGIKRELRDNERFVRLREISSDGAIKSADQLSKESKRGLDELLTQVELERWGKRRRYRYE